MDRHGFVNRVGIFANDARDTISLDFCSFMPALELRDGSQPQLNFENLELDHLFRATMTARTFLSLRDRINNFYEKVLLGDNEDAINGEGNDDE